MSRRDKFYNKENFLFTEQFKKNKSINLFINKLFLFSNKFHEITQEDFKNGPLIIKEPGHYKLMENIVFEPNKHNMGKPTKQQLNKLPIEFNLGFFAGIIIACDNVFLNLNNFTFQQSLLFSVQQTFYANIQIGASPFIKKQGPSKFPDFVKAPNNVVIMNGKLGLSSHHGIHCATGVNKCIITDLEIKEFGVAGIQINGGNSLYINNIHIDNKKSNIIFNSNLSFGIFMLPHFEKLLEEKEDCYIIIKNKKVYVSELFNKLKNEIDKAFSSIKNNTIYSGPFKNKDAPLYDANLYGLVLNSKGILINDFKKEDLSKINDNHDIILNNIKIKNCISAGTEVIVMTNKKIEHENLFYGSGIIRGVHGDVVNFESMINKDRSYKSTLIIDCQICLAQFKELLNHNSINIPSSIIKFSQDKFGNIDKLIQNKDIYIVRGRDSMAHIMKGNIGLFISQGKNILVTDVYIDNIKNTSKPSLEFGKCTEFTKLASSYGALISGSSDITFHNTNIENITSDNGLTETIAFKNNCCNFKIINN